jgi:hypothetical protein
MNRPSSNNNPPQQGEQSHEDNEEEYINLWETTTTTTSSSTAAPDPSMSTRGSSQANAEDEMGEENVVDDDLDDEIPLSPLDQLIQDRARLEHDLSNIRTVIRLTEVNIVSLNERFASIMHPPSEYLMEYEDLTTKLNNFQMQESRLENEMDDVMLRIREIREQIRKQKEKDTSSNLTYSASMILTRPASSNDNQSVSRSITGTSGTSSSAGTSAAAAAGSSSTGSSPLGLIKAWLPNSQRTVVSARAGSTLRQVLMKAMKRRKLRTEGTFIYKKTSCNNEPGGRKEQIDWSADSAAFAGQELVVDLIVDPTIMSFLSTSISHNFMRKTFFSLTFCDVCSRILFHGFRCDVCAFKFHPKCAQHVPNLCQPVSANAGNAAAAGSVTGSDLNMGNNASGISGAAGGPLQSMSGMSSNTGSNRLVTDSGYLTSSLTASSSGGGGSRGRQMRGGSREDEVNDNFYSHLLAMNAPRNLANTSTTTTTAKKKKKKRKNMFRVNRDESSGEASANASQAGTAAGIVSEAAVVPITGQDVDPSSNEGGSRERSTSAPNVHLIHPKHVVSDKKAFRNKVPAFHPISSSAAATPTLRAGREVSSAANTSKTQFFFSSSSSSSSKPGNGSSVQAATTESVRTSDKTDAVAGQPGGARQRARSADESVVHRVQALTEEEAATVRSSKMRDPASSSSVTTGTTTSTSAAAASFSSRKVTTSGIEDWEIPESEIDFGERIGSGSFGTVFKGMWHGPVALKKLNVFKDQKPTQSQLQAFKNEVAVLRFVF